MTIVRKTFGVGITPAYVELIRSEVISEMRGRGSDASGTTIVHVPAVLEPTPKTPEERDSDVEAAVALALDAIPGLRRMVIEVDASGHATYSYEVQAVRTGGGSVAVRR